DCETASKALDLPLDEADPTDGRSYILGVSSPGLDRPLKNERDFARNMGKAVQAKLYRQIDGKKLITGILSGYDGNTVKLETENGTVELAVKDIAVAKPYIEFK
ncbi:MAG TPA: ribosome maturation factor RimP, partial [Clostridia bacterium]|nr:ribosome maturation factor RimP [Clostridia bacterium]